MRVASSADEGGRRYIANDDIVRRSVDPEISTAIGAAPTELENGSGCGSWGTDDHHNSDGHCHSSQAHQSPQLLNTN